MPRSKSVLEVNHVSRDGNEVDLQLPGTNLQWFRVPTNTLTFVDRKPPSIAGSVFDVGTKYLKSEDAPKAVISTLEGMRAKQHESWKTAVERIGEIFEK